MPTKLLVSYIRSWRPYSFINVFFFCLFLCFTRSKLPFHIFCHFSAGKTNHLAVTPIAVTFATSAWSFWHLGLLTVLYKILVVTPHFLYRFQQPIPRSVNSSHMVIKVSKHTTEPPCSSPDKWGRGLTKRQFTVLHIFIFGARLYGRFDRLYFVFKGTATPKKRKKEKKKKISGDRPESPYFTYILISLISLKDELIDNGEKETFDMAYIDADKWNYYIYYDKCMQLVRKGGVILIDDVRIPSQ